MSGLGTGNAGFIYRVAGVCVHEGHVLLHRGVSDDFWSMPGGRPELLESSSAALVREMREEIGAGIEVGRLLWVMEYFFVHAGRRFHELAFYYEIHLSAVPHLLNVRRAFTGIEA